MNRIDFRILLIFYLVSVFIVISSAASPGIRAVNIEMKVGFDEYGIPGGWIPVTIIIENSEKLIDGTLSLYLQDENGNSVSSKYTYNVVLPPASKKTYRGVIPLYQDQVISVLPDKGGRKRTIKSQLVGELTEQGHLLKRENVVLEDFLFDFSGLLVVKDSGTGFTFLNILADIEEVIYEYTRNLPVNWLAYTGINTIIFDDVELADLNQNQITAIRNWVLQGGTIIINGDGLEKMLNTQVLGDIFPGRVGTRRTVNLKTTAVDRNSDYRGIPGEYLPQSGSLEVYQMKDIADSAVMTAEGIPLLFDRSYGRGRVLVFTFDLKRWDNDKWPTREKFMGLFLSSGDNVIQNFKLSESGNDFLGNITGEMLSSLELKAPSRWLILLILALFTGLLYGIYNLLFANYNIMKKVILIVGVSLVTVIFSAVFLQQTMDDYSNLLGEVAVINKYDDSELAFIEGYYIGFASSGRSLLPAVSINDGLITGAGNQINVYKKEEEIVNIDSEKYSYLLQGSSSWSIDFFKGYYLTDLPLTISAERTEGAENQINLIIENNTGLEISRWFLKSDEGWYEVDNSAVEKNSSGSKITYQFAPGINWHRDPPWNRGAQELLMEKGESALERKVLDILYKRKVQMQPQAWQDRDFVILVLDGQNGRELENKVYLQDVGRKEYKGFIILPVKL